MQRKKFILDLKVVRNIRINDQYTLLKLTSDQKLPEILPGQFAQIRIDGSQTTFLRRPISINFVDYQTNELWLLIQIVGDGTKRLSEMNKDDVLNLILPLGNSFTVPENMNSKIL